MDDNLSMLNINGGVEALSGRGMRVSKTRFRSSMLSAPCINIHEFFLIVILGAS